MVLPGFVVPLFPEITAEDGHSLWIWECHHLPALCNAPQSPLMSQRPDLLPPPVCLTIKCEGGAAPGRTLCCFGARSAPFNLY